MEGYVTYNDSCMQSYIFSAVKRDVLKQIVYFYVFEKEG